VAPIRRLEAFTKVKRKEPSRESLRRNTLKKSTLEKKPQLLAGYTRRIIIVYKKEHHRSGAGVMLGLAV